jgi:L-ascorbate metabolism protein UlaG (beta-lactamase superfamily)
MKHFFTLSLFCTALAAFAQRPAADEIKTVKGPLMIQPILHGSVVFTCNKKTIYIDPYGAALAYKGLAAPDLILITDIHPDHLDTTALNGIPGTTKAKFIVPKAVADKLPAKYKTNMIVLNNDQKITEDGIIITAIPMYNLPEAEDAMHTKGRGNGYIINLAGKIIYISGDTEDTPEMLALKNIDIAFVCMNLPYTMDIKQAAKAVLAFKPGIVYPYHYRGKEGLSDVNEFKKLIT